MSLGVHFALSARDAARILKFKSPDQLVDFIAEDIEERYLDSGKWAYESDKAWDAIHRCLTDGRISVGSGPFPLGYAVLGGRALDAGDEYTACLVDADQVTEVSDALNKVAKDWMERQYQSLPRSEYGPTSPEEFEYVWEYFEGMRIFFAKAAKGGRPVLFTTDA